MDDKEKKRVLEALMLIAHKTTEQLGLPQPDSPTLQIGNSLYILSASGHLEKCDCKQQPRLLSAWVVNCSEEPAMRSVSFQRSAQHLVSSRRHYLWHLVALAADASLGDQLHLHFEDGSRTVTKDAKFDESASCGQAVQLTIMVPCQTKRVVAVELLRSSFASRRVGVSYPKACSQHRYAGQHTLMDPRAWPAGMSLLATSQCSGTSRTAMLILLSATLLPFELFYFGCRPCLQCYYAIVMITPANIVAMVLCTLHDDCCNTCDGNPEV